MPAITFLLSTSVISNAQAAKGKKKQTSSKTHASGAQGTSYKNYSSIMLKDVNNTSMAGVIRFNSGVPTKETQKNVAERMYFNRAIETFLQGYRAVDAYNVHIGLQKGLGIKSYKDVAYFAPMSPKSLFLTPNSDTYYALGFIDFNESDVMVVNVPSKTGPSLFLNPVSGFDGDFGLTGPDAGRGGKYMIVKPGTDLSKMKIKVSSKTINGKKVSIAKYKSIKYFLVNASSNSVTYAVRFNPSTEAERNFKSHFKIHTLKSSDISTHMNFIDGSKKDFNTNPPVNAQVFSQLKHVIDSEGSDIFTQHEKGIFSSIGISKNEKFNPNKRQKELLEEAAVVANAHIRAKIFNPKLQDVKYNDGNSSWFMPIHDNLDFIFEDKDKGIDHDLKSAYFYLIQILSPSVGFVQEPGQGSTYLLSSSDADGNQLIGNNDYVLHLDPNVPAANFWSLTLYDADTRGLIRNIEGRANVNNLAGASKDMKAVANEDGSYDIYLSSSSSAKKKDNYIQTKNGQKFFAIFRLYGADKAYISGEWKLNDIVKIENESKK